MASLKSVDHHNMVACLEKSEENTKFHQIVDFLSTCSINYALTVSPTIYASYIEQFWNTTTSKTVNSVKQIHAIVNDRAVVISELSVRNDLLFDDEDVNNEKQIHATVDSKAVVVTEASIKISLLLNDVDGTACLTNETSFQNLALMGYEGELNKLTFQKALLSPQWKYLIHTILHCLSSKSTSWNEFSTNIASAVICLATNQKFNFSELIFNGMLRNLDTSKKKFLMYPRFLMVFLNNQIEFGEPFNDVYVTPAHTQKVFSNMSRKGEENAKPEPTLDAFDDLDADGRDYMETEGRQSNETEELNKDSGEKGGSTEELVSTDGPKTVSTARPKLSTARPDVDAARQEDSDVEPRTPPTTTSIFDDEDITMAQTLIKMKEEKAKEKGVSIKDIEDSSRPERSILTLKPLPTIDPKDKGKSVLEELNPAKKMTISDFDREEEASKAAIAKTYDEVQVGIDVDALFAAKLQREEREEYTIEETTKFLAETISTQRKFRAAQRSAEIRSRPPTKSQLGNLMMTYLKNMDDDAVIDSKEAAGVNKQEVFKEPNSTKVEVKQKGHKESIRKRSGRRLKMKATKKSKRQKTPVDLEEEEQLKSYLKIVPNEEGIIDCEVLEKRFPIIKWESKFYDFYRHGTKCIYYRIFRSDGSSSWIKTFSKMVTRFDRLDLVELYNLVMKRFEKTTPEGVDLVLWGDLRIMFDANAEDELWQNQERWNLKSWDFYENCSVHTLILEDGTEIYMLAERMYPLTKETLKRMLSLRLVVGTTSEDAYTLLRFIQK
ncbi:hypothetical protein Tco_0718268 [Tanacetum coccineum]